jgi:hypothetical protein
LSLLDVLLASFIRNSRVISADESGRIEAEMRKAVTVAEWELGNST